MTVRLIGDRIEFGFPDVDPGAVLTIDLHRTLRIPDDARTQGRGRFPADVPIGECLTASVLTAPLQSNARFSDSRSRQLCSPPICTHRVCYES